jgi:hypothetical protein
MAHLHSYSFLFLIPLIILLLIILVVFTAEAQTHRNVPSPPVHAIAFILNADHLAVPLPQFVQLPF